MSNHLLLAFKHNLEICLLNFDWLSITIPNNSILLVSQILSSPMPFTVFLHLSPEIKSWYFSVFSFNYLLTNQLVDRKESRSNLFMRWSRFWSHAEWICIIDIAANVSFFQKEKIVYRMFKKMSKRIGPITDSSCILFIIFVQEL